MRWIRPGSLAASVIEWFSRFVEEIESRDDTYLVDQRIPGVSVKIRGGALLEIKVAGGHRGVLDMPGQARGRLQSWKKWSFPIPQGPGQAVQFPDWVRIGKLRRISRFAYADGRATARRSPSINDEVACAVELTEVMKGEEPWWTLGFEASGHPATIRGAAIEATAALVFNDPLPRGLELGGADSMSYSAWLCQSKPNEAT